MLSVDYCSGRVGLINFGLRLFLVSVGELYGYDVARGLSGFSDGEMKHSLREDDFFWLRDLLDQSGWYSMFVERGLEELGLGLWESIEDNGYVRGDMSWNFSGIATVGMYYERCMRYWKESGGDLLLSQGRFSQEQMYLMCRRLYDESMQKGQFNASLGALRLLGETFGLVGARVGQILKTEGGADRLLLSAEELVSKIEGSSKVKESVSV